LLPSTCQNVPGYANFGGLRILVSPFMRFDTSSKTTDLIMFNSRNLGALIVDQRPHVRSWDDPQYSIQNLAIEESYGFGVLNEGQAIAVAKNVRVRANEMSTPARPIISVGPDNTAFEKPSALVGGSPRSAAKWTATTSRTQCFHSRALLPSWYPLPENRLPAAGLSSTGAALRDLWA
jgi:hypothetical protein